MSRELDYFPPAGTICKWSTKALNYSPWYLNFWSHWPASIEAWVDLSKDGSYTWCVEVNNFYKSRFNFKGTAQDGLVACLEAEKICLEQKQKIWLPWMDDAVAAGWRSPGI